MYSYSAQQKIEQQMSEVRQAMHNLTSHAEKTKDILEAGSSETLEMFRLFLVANQKDIAYRSLICNLSMQYSIRLGNRVRVQFHDLQINFLEGLPNRKYILYPFIERDMDYDEAYKQHKFEVSFKYTVFIDHKKVLQPNRKVYMLFSDTQQSSSAEALTRHVQKYALNYVLSQFHTIDIHKMDLWSILMNIRNRKKYAYGIIYSMSKLLTSKQELPHGLKILMDNIKQYDESNGKKLYTLYGKFIGTYDNRFLSRIEVNKMLREKNLFDSLSK